jgi:hypothetical protein
MSSIKTSVLKKAQEIKLICFTNITEAAIDNIHKN